MQIGYYETQYCKVFETGERVKVGSFTSDESFNLKYIRAKLYKKGLARGKTKVVISSSSDFLDNMAESSWIKNTELEDFSFVNFEFIGANIRSDCKYYISFVTENYTRDGDNTYIGALHDWPDSTYASSTGGLLNGHGIYFAVFGET